MEALPGQLNYVLCNFGLKSRLRYLTKLHFTSLNYHKVDKFYFKS